MKKQGQTGIVLLLGVFFLSGCATMLNGYGTNVLDEIAWAKFENFQIDPDMNYYASGPQDPYPIVIIGLKKEYTLDNNLWRPLPPDPKLFKDLVTRMQFEAQRINQVQRGFVLKSPAGQNIGICYCRITAWVNVMMGEGNKVIVYTPDSEENSYILPDRGAD